MSGYPKKLRNVVLDGICTQGMVSIIGGPFLSAFLIYLGANLFWIGVAAAIPPLAQLIQIPSIYLVERFPYRRIICVIAASLSRLFWLFPIIATFLAPPKIVLSLTLIAILAQSSIGAISGTSWNSWMRDLIPQSILGRFFSHRMRLSTAFGLFLSVVAALFLQLYSKLFNITQLESYSIVFSMGLLSGIGSIFFLYRTPEPKLEVMAHQSLLKKLINPLKDKNYRTTIIFLGLWNFAINLAIPFFVVYLLKRLGYGMGMVIGFAVISQVANIIAFPMWGRFADHFSNKTVLAVAGPMFLVVILMWPFTTLPHKYFFTVPLLVLIHIIGGFSTAGTMLASGNIALKQAPQGEATSYLAVNSVVSSIAMFLAPLVGGAIAYYFSVRELAVTVRWHSPGTEIVFRTMDLKELDFLFFIAAIVGFLVIQVLGYIREEGEVKEKILIKELLGQMQRNILNISTVTGFRFLVAFPYQLVRRPITTIKKVKKVIVKSDDV